ncbi:MAG: hypothetical protein RLZZ67_537 [Candidatus Parcubacteria bacterium]|jgi:uncharacterized protein YcnI
MKTFFSGAIAIVAFALLPILADAHATVKPSQVGIGAFQTFSLAVPVEKDIPTTAIRLIVPEGLGFVTPTLKQGWKIDVKKEKTGKTITDDDGMEIAEEKVTEISWTGGSIPAGFRDEFGFSAQVPALPTELVWKAYQTYKDGSVVSWDQPHTDDHAAKKETKDENSGPYSETAVIDDLAGADDHHASKGVDVSFALSAIALAISVVAIQKSKRA